MLNKEETENIVMAGTLNRIGASAFAGCTSFHTLWLQSVTPPAFGAFSTVDLAEMNLYDGTCMFYKVGAAATFVRHKGRYECLLSENLPTGVTCHLNVVPQKRTLADNDWIVMVTDGVLEYLNVDRPEEEMIAILNEIDTQNPTQFARAVLERVLFEQSGEAKDDMTVLCAGIWKKSVREKKWKQES